MKTYATKSNARRAAKQAGLTEEQFSIIEVEGKFSFQEIVAEDKKSRRHVEEENTRFLQQKIEAARTDLDLAICKDLLAEADYLAEGVAAGFAKAIEAKYDNLPVIGDFARCPHCETHLSNGYQTHENLVADGHKGCAEFEYLCLACNGEFGPAIIRKEKKVAKKGTRVVTDKSTTDRPTKKVWHIADAMFDRAEANGEPQPKRKDVIDECVKSGIAFYTARTQYQQWWQCRNGKA